MTTDTSSEQETNIHGGSLDRSKVQMVDVGQDIVTVKVWELPVRLIHWVLFGSVMVLAVTGFYIGSPFLDAGDETGFTMGRVRFIHALTAWVFILAVLSRIVWAFIGNRWARWRQFVPVDKVRRHWGKETLKYYLFMKKEPPPAVGHNPLAGLTYLVVYAMFFVQILSGLALQALASPGSWKWSVAGWLFEVMSLQAVRLMHHMIMWLTLGFMIHHIFSALLVDMDERSGLVSSIITGYKRVPRERL